MSKTRIVKTVHGVRQTARDPEFEIQLAAAMRERMGSDELLEVYTRFSTGPGYSDTVLRA